jgi:hypothetical protein
MSDDKTLKALQGYSGVFKWGSGLLGKSAIVVWIAVAGILVGLWSLHSDWMKFSAMLLVIALIFGWYIPLLKFCNKHPENALLEGVQWSEHHRLELAAKGFEAAAPNSATLPSPTAEPPSGLITQHDNRRLS